MEKPLVLGYGDGIPLSYVGIGEIRDGNVAKMTEYFADPFGPWSAAPAISRIGPILQREDVEDDERDDRADAQDQSRHVIVLPYVQLETSILGVAVRLDIWRVH